MTEVSTSELRRRILHDRDLATANRRMKRRGSTLDDDSLPDEFPMTPRMKYIEIKYNIKLKLDLFNGSLNEVCQRYGWEVDRSTLSRWRKHIRRFLINLEVKDDKAT